jgi:dimethylhistidine N-methyltransferase
MRTPVTDYSLSLIDQFKEDVFYGLSQSPKSIPSKYFYDEQGSRYFECICRCKEYYVTRTETSIMKKYAQDMAQMIGDNCLVLEYGSGASLKTRHLFDHLSNPCAYIPIDICQRSLENTLSEFGRLYPALEVIPLCADFTQELQIPMPQNLFDRKLIYFPGSTIGNFPPISASDLLRQMHSSCLKGDLVLLGVDLRKPKKILLEAYNDRHGYTAAFNLNLLKRINYDLQGDFNLKNFSHEAVYNDREHCIDMYLISTTDQEVIVSDQTFYFYNGEHIHTESSYKYDLFELEQLTYSLGFLTSRIWTDQKKYFAVLLLEVAHETH